MPLLKKQKNNNSSPNLANILVKIGISIIIVSFIILFLFIYPVIKMEVKYLFIKSDSSDNQFKQDINKSLEQDLTPVDKDFGIVIPKIDVNSKIIKDVDPKIS